MRNLVFRLIIPTLEPTIYRTIGERSRDVAYGIGTIKRNVKNVAVFFPDITSKTLKLRQVPFRTFC